MLRKEGKKERRKERKKEKRKERKKESRKAGRKEGRKEGKEERPIVDLKCGPAQPSLFVLKRLGPGPKTQSKG